MSIRFKYNNGKFWPDSDGEYRLDPSGEFVHIPSASALLAERGSSHGDSERQFEFAQELKAALRTTYARPTSELSLTLHQIEALEMICVKISRICCGNPHFEDHWRDISGYATLVAEALAKHK